MFNIVKIEKYIYQISNGIDTWNFEIDTSIWSEAEYNLRWKKALEVLISKNNSYSLMVFNYNKENIFAYILYRESCNVYIRERLFNSDINGSIFNKSVKENNPDLLLLNINYEKNRYLTKADFTMLEKDGIHYRNKKGMKLFSEIHVDINDINIFLNETNLFNRWPNS